MTSRAAVTLPVTRRRSGRGAVALAVAALALAACDGSTPPTSAASSPGIGSSSPEATTVGPEPTSATPEPTTPEPTTTEPTTTEPTTTLAAPTTSAPPPSAAPRPSSTTASPTTAARLLKPGARGAAVADLQRRLLALGYWLPSADGVYGDSTRHAVVALQKASGLSRDGVLGPATRRALGAGTRWSPDAKGDAIVVDLRRQLLGVVRAGRLVLTLDASTGSGVTYRQPDGDLATATTPTGTFAVAWQVDGWRTSQLGRLYRPKYFHPRGIAVHGFPSVPPTAASHGCVRVTMAGADMIWRQNLMPIGSRVIVG